MPLKAMVSAIPYLFFLKYSGFRNNKGRYLSNAFDGEYQEGDGERNTVSFLNYSGYLNNNKDRYWPNAHDGEDQEGDGECNTVLFSKI